MSSQIYYDHKNGNTKIQIIVGFFSTILLIALALIFHNEFKIMLLTASGALGIWTSVKIGELTFTTYYNVKMLVLKHRRELAETEIVEAERDERKNHAFVVHLPTQHNMIVSRDLFKASGSTLIPATISNTNYLLPMGDYVEPENNLKKLEDIIERQPFITWLFGAMDGGKTTYAYDVVISAKQKGQDIFIIDPMKREGHDEKWPENILVASHERDIIQIFSSFIDLMVKRMHEPITAKHTLTTLIVDEFTTVKDILADAGIDVIRALKVVFSKNRQASGRIVFVTHFKTIQGTGLEGLHHAKEQSVQIFFLGKNSNGFHYEIIEEGKTEKEQAIFNPSWEAISATSVKVEQTEKGLSMHDLLLADNSPKPSKNEQEIINAYLQEKEKENFTWVGVTNALGWVATGPNNKRIKNILDKWAINY